MYVTLALLSDVLDHLEAKNGFRSDGFTMSVYGAIMVGMTGLGEWSDQCIAYSHRI